MQRIEYALEERAKRRLALFPFTTWKGKGLHKRIFKDFTVETTICDVLRVNLVAAALFIDPIKDFINAFIIVLILSDVFFD